MNINDFYIKDTVLIRYTGNDEHVDIPKYVTKIYANAFSSSSTLHSVTIPFGIKEIEQNAFYNCQSLEYVYIPDSVTNIGDSAFCCCDSLAWAYIPKSLTHMGYDVFLGCDDLMIVSQNEYIKRIFKYDYPDIKFGLLVNKDNKILYEK